MSKITFTLEADVDGEPGPDMAVELHEALLKTLHRAAMREGSGLGRTNGIDRLAISNISLTFDDPNAFSNYERREYNAGAALITEACREIIFYGYNDEAWSHSANGASRSFYGLIDGKPALLDAHVGFRPGENEVDCIRVVAPDSSVPFERKSVAPLEEDLPSPG